MSRHEIRIGTRGSPLALAQARLVAEALEHEGQRTRLVIIRTAGDRRVPDTAWGEGAFVTAIEAALRTGRVDLAVHSAKDVPTAEAQRLRIAAYLERADPRDGLVVARDRSTDLDSLPSGSRVGTDSPRRTAFVLARRPDLRVHALHGNVDTRLRRLDANETDALILAAAGLDRLGLRGRVAEYLDPAVVPPAPGQGAIAVQVRAGDARTLALVEAIDHAPTRRAVEAERVFLIASGGGCRAPIGALATVDGEALDLLGGHALPDGSAAEIARRRGRLADADTFARDLALELDARMRGARAPAAGPARRRSLVPRVIVTRAADQAGELECALSDRGLNPVLVPAIAVELEPPGGELDRFARRLDGYRWVVITSGNGARAMLGAAGRVAGAIDVPRWAVVGRTTGRVLEAGAIAVDFEPSRALASALAAELPILPGDPILLVRGDLADPGLASGLRARGAVIDEVVAYRTMEAPESSRVLLRGAMAEGPIAAALFTSGSTVRGLLSLGEAESINAAAFPAACIGPETAEAARSAGFQILAVAPAPTAAALAAATAGALTSRQQETR